MSQAARVFYHPGPQDSELDQSNAGHGVTLNRSSGPGSTGESRRHVRPMARPGAICDNPLVQLPEPPIQRVVIQRYAEVLEALQLTPGEQPLVLPTSEWFPDRFTGDQASFEGLVARMQGYAGLEDQEIEAVLVGAEEAASCGAGGCGTGGCATPKQPLEGPRLVARDSGFRFEMPAAAVAHPIALTAGVARLLGQLRLVRRGNLAADAVLAELSATALGFGVLLLEGSYLYSKSCGGPSVGTTTALSVGELGLAMAIFLEFEGHKPRAALAELSTTQRAVLEEARAVVESNRSIVEQLKARPQRIQQGRFELGEARSFLARWFSGKKKRTPGDAESLALVALERGDSVENIAALLDQAPNASALKAQKPRAQDDVGDLVDEALAELRGPSSGRSAAE